VSESKLPRPHPAPSPNTSHTQSSQEAAHPSPQPSALPGSCLQLLACDVWSFTFRADVGEAGSWGAGSLRDFHCPAVDIWSRFYLICTSLSSVDRLVFILLMINTGVSICCGCPFQFPSSVS
jgi:hypothetical protein